MKVFDVVDYLGKIEKMRELLTTSDDTVTIKTNDANMILFLLAQLKMFYMNMETE